MLCSIYPFFPRLPVVLCGPQQSSHDLHRPSHPPAERPAARPPRPQTTSAETTQLQRRGGTHTHTPVQLIHSYTLVDVS